MIEIENVPLDSKIYSKEGKSVDVKIVEYFCKNRNILSIPGWIAASFSEPLHVGNTVKRCKKLCENGILKSEIVYAKGYGGGFKQAYKLNLTVENLKNLVFELYIEDLVRLMRTPDYTELLPDMMRYFENALLDQEFEPLIPDVKEVIGHLLKISPACLRFVFDDKGYKSTTRKQEMLLSKSSKVKSNPRQRKIVKDRMFMYIFIKFAHNDWMLGFTGSKETDYIKNLVKLSAMDY